MFDDNNIYIFYFSANLIYIVACVICALVKCRQNRSMMLDDSGIHNKTSRREYAFFLLTSLLQIPYLLNINSGDALLYSRLFTLLMFPMWEMILIERFFYKKGFLVRHIMTLSMIFIILLAPFWYFAIWIEDVFSVTQSRIFIGIAFLITTAEVILGLKNMIKLVRFVRFGVAQEFSNEEDFPMEFAHVIIAIIPVLFLTIVLSLFESRMAKAFVDILNAGLVLWITISTIFTYDQINKYNNTLVSSKKDIDDPEDEEYESEDTHKNRERTTDNTLLTKQIIDKVLDEQLYKNSSLRLNDITRKVCSNRKYVSTAISESQFGSFYNMINNFRVIYALAIKRQNPSIKQEELAIISGFSSRFTLARWLKKCDTTKYPFNDSDLLKRIEDKL